MQNVWSSSTLAKFPHDGQSLYRSLGTFAVAAVLSFSWSIANLTVSEREILADAKCEQRATDKS